MEEERKEGKEGGEEEEAKGKGRWRWRRRCMSSDGSFFLFTGEKQVEAVKVGRGDAL